MPAPDWQLIHESALTLEIEPTAVTETIVHCIPLYGESLTVNQQSR